MRIEEQENNNPFGMKISDPELVRKICEGGMESLSPDDINMIGLGIKNDQMFMGDESQANLEGVNILRYKTAESEQIGPSPLSRGMVGYIALLFVVFVALSVVGIACSNTF